MLSETTLKKMVIEAMKEKDPTLFQELTNSGELEAFAQMRATDGMETYQTLIYQALDQSATSIQTLYEKIQQHTIANQDAKTIVIRQVTEFPNP